MISIEKIKKLEQKVSLAVETVTSLQKENAALRAEKDELNSKLDEYSSRISELEVLINAFKQDQSEIEEGITNALAQLDRLEDELNPPEASSDSSLSGTTTQKTTDKSSATDSEPTPQSETVSEHGTTESSAKGIPDTAGTGSAKKSETVTAPEETESSALGSDESAVAPAPQGELSDRNAVHGDDEFNSDHDTAPQSGLNSSTDNSDSNAESVSSEDPEVGNTAERDHDTVFTGSNNRPESVEPEQSEDLKTDANREDESADEKKSGEENELDIF